MKSFAVSIDLFHAEGVDGGDDMDRKGKFEMGRLFITTNARDALDTGDVLRAVERHREGDWGELCPEDAQQNELALREGLRLLSAYRTEGGPTFWIITESDRSCTTVLLPEDY